jgi:hypothetical protein
VNRAQRRLAALGAALGLLLTTAALFAPGAQAVLKPTLVLKAGQTISLHGGPFAGVTRPYETYNGTFNASDGNQYLEPSHCDGSDPSDPAASDCDRFPIKLSVPKSDLGVKDYLITVRLNWNIIGKVKSVPLAGDVNVHQLDAYLWENPIPHLFKDGKDTGTNAPPSLSSINENAPVKMALVDPKVLTYDLVVANRAGPDAEGYDLTVQLQDLTGPLPIDLSIDTGGLPPASSTASSAGKPVPTVRSSAEPTPATPSPASVAIPTLPGLAGVGPDSQLDRAGGIPLDLNPTQAALAGQGRNLGPPGPASGLGLVLSLVVVPAVILGLGAAWFARRRSGLLRI